MNFKKMLSLMLVAMLVISMIPSAVFATEETAAPELPTLTMTEIQNENLDFALNFALTELTWDQSWNYNNWYADFYITFNKAVTLNGDGTGDVMISARNEAIGVADWTGFPFAPVSVNAGEAFGVMEYVFELEGDEYVTTLFDATVAFTNADLGVKINPEFLEANPDLMVNIDSNKAHWTICT